MQLTLYLPLPITQKGRNPQIRLTHGITKELIPTQFWADLQDGLHPERLMGSRRFALCGDFFYCYQNPDMIPIIEEHLVVSGLSIQRHLGIVPHF